MISSLPYGLQDQLLISGTAPSTPPADGEYLSKFIVNVLTLAPSIPLKMKFYFFNMKDPLKFEEE